MRIVFHIKKNNNKNFFNFAAPLFCLATLFFSATLRPSVPGGFYFLIFLLSGSYWATFQTLQRYDNRKTKINLFKVWVYLLLFAFLFLKKYSKENMKISFCRKFAILLRFVMVVIVAHTICIVAYQTPWMQDHLDKNSLAARWV